jgi:hypothetical protein
MWRDIGLTVILCLAGLLGCARVLEPLGVEPTPGIEEALRTWVSENAGPGHDVLLPAGTEVVSVNASVEGAVTVDFSRELLHQPVRLDTDERVADLIRPVVEEYHPGTEIMVLAGGDPPDLFVPRPFGGQGPHRDREAEIAPPPGPALVRPDPASPLPPSQGLAGRHIALWHSHGWYYSDDADRWLWQRPRMFTAVEDMLPMGFVLPFLVPMLENAGAVTLLPRERDFQPKEVVVDETDRAARFTGEWEEADDPGFQPGLVPLPKDVNPHAQGTHRVAVCTGPESERFPSVSWTPRIPADGDYAVTVAYGAASDRATDACYVIRHAGGMTRRLVNQRMAGHTWVYLGTFTFRQGMSSLDGSVALEARSASPGATVSADAVRFGGGMGTVEIGGRTGGQPRHMEAAHLWQQYAGAPPELTYRTDGDWNEYTQDYASRPEWVNWMHGAPNGPNSDRDHPGLRVPVDLSMAFHTDAGITDGIAGTLMIVTSHAQGSVEQVHHPDGRPRWLNRELGDLVQTQVVEDIRATFSPDWTRRQLWTRDGRRSYAESRRPNVPSILLELASHQEFNDQTSLQDPRFRSLVSRAIYKGMLRWIAAENGFEPVVQPLPPTHRGPRPRAIRARLEGADGSARAHRRARGISRLSPQRRTRRAAVARGARRRFCRPDFHSGARPRARGARPGDAPLFPRHRGQPRGRELPHTDTRRGVGGRRRTGGARRRRLRPRRHAAHRRHRGPA